MLYLKPPFYMINGVSLFSDHADPLYYHYLPAYPYLTQIQNPVTKQRTPQIQVIKYRGKAGNGGFLNFDVNLGIDPEALEEVRRELKRMAQLPELPRLGPVSLTGGSVKLMLFGRQSGDSPPEGTTPRFVLKLDHSSTPSLYGDNQAAFSVQLDQEGITILEQALQGELSPIGVVYSLDYLALRPAYSVRLQIDWERVQKHLEESFRTSFLIFSSQIDKVVDELIENRSIILEADTFVPEGEDTSGVLNRRDQAVNEVREMITDAFFQPSLEPMRQEKDGWDKAAQFIERVSLIGATHGLANQAAFTYRKLDYKRIDRKRLNVNMSERTTIKRTICPQGHLSGLFRIFEQEKLDPSKFMISVDTDDPWFDRRRVKVISRANFEEDNIASVAVNLRYGSNTKSVVLDLAKPQDTVEWNSLLVNGAMRQEVIARYKVMFKGIDSTERPLTLISPEEQIETENLEINPRELYALVPIPILALNFPWKRYPTVEVQTRYLNVENKIRITDTFLLNEKRPEETWNLFMRHPERQKFEYKLIFRAADHRDLEMPWVMTDEERVIIRDPRPNKRSLQIVPNVVWSEVKVAFVDVTYEDKANRVFQSDSFEFTEEDDLPKTFIVDLVNPDLRLVSYQATILYHDGRRTEIPPSVTRDRRIIIRDDMEGHKIITVQPAKVDFLRKKVKEMLVEIRYSDVDAGLEFADQFTFQSMSDRAFFEFDYVDSHKTSYEYRVTYRMTNNLTRSTKWQKVNADELAIPVG